MHDFDTFLLELLFQNLGEFRQLLGGKPLAPIHNRDLRTQPPEGLRHFAADGAAADDQQMLRQFFQVVKKRFVVVQVGLLGTRYIQFARFRSGGQDETLSGVGLAVYFQGFLIQKVRPTDEYVQFFFLPQVIGVFMGANDGLLVVYVGHHSFEIGFAFRFQTKSLRLPGVSELFGDVNHRLAGNAAKIQAVAAHAAFVFFDEQHF